MIKFLKPRIDNSQVSSQPYTMRVLKALFLLGVMHAAPIPFIPNLRTLSLMSCRITVLTQCTIRDSLPQVHLQMVMKVLIPPLHLEFRVLPSNLIEW